MARSLTAADRKIIQSIDRIIENEIYPVVEGATDDSQINLENGAIQTIISSSNKWRDDLDLIRARLSSATTLNILIKPIDRLVSALNNLHKQYSLSNINKIKDEADKLLFSIDNIGGTSHINTNVGAVPKSELSKIGVNNKKIPKPNNGRGIVRFTDDKKQPLTQSINNSNESNFDQLVEEKIKQNFINSVSKNITYLIAKLNSNIPNKLAANHRNLVEWTNKDLNRINHDLILLKNKMDITDSDIYTKFGVSNIIIEEISNRVLELSSIINNLVSINNINGLKSSIDDLMEINLSIDKVLKLFNDFNEGIIQTDYDKTIDNFLRLLNKVLQNVIDDIASYIYNYQNIIINLETLLSNIHNNDSDFIAQYVHLSHLSDRDLREIIMDYVISMNG